HPTHSYFRETIRLPDGGKGYSVEGADVDTVVGGVAYWRRSAIKDGVFTMESRGRSLQPEFPAAQADEIARKLAEMGKVEVNVVAPPGYRWTAADRASRIA